MDQKHLVIPLAQNILLHSCFLMVEEYQEDAREGDSLVLASGRSENPISTGCMDSSCGTCEVIVLEGGDSLSPITSKETATKEANDIPVEHRLGCQTAVFGEGVKVQIINVLGVDGDFLNCYHQTIKTPQRGWLRKIVVYPFYKPTKSFSSRVVDHSCSKHHPTTAAESGHSCYLDYFITKETSQLGL